MDRTKLRKNFWFFATAAVCFIVGRYVGIRGAWGHDAFDEIGGVEFFGILLLFAAAVVVMFWFHGWWSTVLAFGLGIAAALWTNDVLGGISWTGVAMIAGTIIVLLLLRSLTVGDARFLRFRRRPRTSGSSDRSASAATTSNNGAASAPSGPSSVSWTRESVN